MLSDHVALDELGKLGCGQEISRDSNAHTARLQEEGVVFLEIKILDLVRESNCLRYSALVAKRT